MVDYYEFLQISPNADPETIHRVYRFLAARFHPDNHQSGNTDMFSQLRVAYDILSDPSRRAEYDTLRRQKPQQPLSFTIDFMDHLDGELNRRLAVLAMLYYRRRRSPNLPEVSLAELEERMGFPRDYLDFTLWYLQKKGYIASKVADGGPERGGLPQKFYTMKPKGEQALLASVETATRISESFWSLPQWKPLHMKLFPKKGR